MSEEVVVLCCDDEGRKEEGERETGASGGFKYSEGELLADFEYHRSGTYHLGPGPTQAVKTALVRACFPRAAR